MVNCSICGRELTNDASVIRGIGPVCRNNVLERTRFYNQKVCTYRVELLEAEKICIIIESTPEGKAEISLTNCIEYVLQEVIQRFELCPKEWAFVQQSGRGHGLFGDYTHCDLVDISTPALYWRYIWHSDASAEVGLFSRALITDRVNKYRAGAKVVIETKTEATA